MRESADPPCPAAGGVRLAKFLSQCGVASRRKAEDLVREGRVEVNGATATDLGRRVDPAADRVRVDGRALRHDPRALTLAYFKPRGVLVSRGDPEGRRTVYDELPSKWRGEAPRLLYAGRLDLNSEGLLVLTTDGSLVQAMTRAGAGVEKEYHVRLGRMLSKDELDQLRRGVRLEGEERPTAPCKAWPLDDGGPRRYAIVLREGRNRQVRRMAEALGVQVERLRRVRIGGVALGGMAPGEWRLLDRGEAERLRSNPAPRESARAPVAR